MIVLAWWAEKSKRTGVRVSAIAFTLIFVVWLKGWGGTLLLLILLALRSMERMPAFLRYGAVALTVFLLAEYRFRILAAGVMEIAEENERTRAQLLLMESSLSAKLDRLSEPVNE